MYSRHKKLFTVGRNSLSYVEIAKFCIPKPIFKVNQMSKLFIPPNLMWDNWKSCRTYTFSKMKPKVSRKEEAEF